MNELLAIPDDLRVDADDLRDMQNLMDRSVRATVRMMTEPFPGTTGEEAGIATGCVLKTTTVSFNVSPNRVTFNAGLKVAFGNGSIILPTPDGEVFELDGPMEISDACPTVGQPHIWIMARSTMALVDGTPDERVVYDQTVASKENLATIPTRSTRSVDFGFATSAGDAAIMVNGGAYHRVCHIEYNSGGNPIIVEWFGLFADCLWDALGAPQTGNRIMASMAQFAHAVAKRLTKITGYADESWWLTDPATTLAAAKTAADNAAAAIAGVQAVDITQNLRLGLLETSRVGMSADIDALKTAFGVECKRADTDQTLTAELTTNVSFDTSVFSSAVEGVLMFDLASEPTRIRFLQSGVYHLDFQSRVQLSNDADHFSAFGYLRAYFQAPAGGEDGSDEWGGGQREIVSHPSLFSRYISNSLAPHDPGYDQSHHVNASCDVFVDIDVMSTLRVAIKNMVFRTDVHEGDDVFIPLAATLKWARLVVTFKGAKPA